MEGLLKNKIFLFSVLLNVTLLIFAIASCSETKRQQQIIDEEMLQRLRAEEKLNNATQEIQGFQERIDAVGRQLEQERASHELTQKALLQERLVIKAIKEELNKATKSQDKP